MRSLALALAVSVPLLASAAQAAPAEAKSKPVKLAAPGFTAVNVDEKVATFFSDHFAQQLALNGLSVISASEIQALIGFERSKQLMGCSDNSQSCLAELGGALGVDGVVTGSIGKFGGTFQANIKVLAAGNAQALSIISRKASSDEEMLNALTDAAQQAAADVLSKLGRAPVQVAERPKEGGHTSRESDSPRGPEKIAGGGPSAQGLVRSGPSNVVTFWGGGALFGLWGVEYERVLASSFELALMPFAGYTSDATSGVSTFDLELELAFRWNPLGTAPAGPFVGPYARLAYVSGWSSVTSLSAVAIAPGLMAGWTFLLGPVALSLGLGGHYYLATDSRFNMWGLSLRANVGVAF